MAARAKIELWWVRLSGKTFLSRWQTEAAAIVAANLHASTRVLPQYYEIRLSNKVSKAYGVLPTSTPPPLTPTGLTLESVSGGSFTVFWTDGGDAASWTVYVDGVPSGSPVTTASIFVSGVGPPSSSHDVQVQAHNAAGSSALSAALAVLLTANSLPIWTVSDLPGAVGQAFSFDMATACEDFDGHTLSFSVIGGLPPGVTQVGSVIAGTPTLGGDYAITVRADDGFDTADASLTISVAAAADVTPPTDPANVVSVANGSTVTTTWDLSTDASGISLYRVFRNGVFLGTIPEPPHIEAGVPDGTHTYSVRAKDASPNGNLSAQIFGSPVVVAVTPPAPDTPVYGVPVVVSTTRIDHSWAAGPSGATPTSYELDRSLTGLGGWSNVFTGLALSFSDTSLTAGTTYFYRLRALNGVAASGYATRSATTQSAGSSGYEFPVTPLGTSAFALTATPTFHNIGLKWDEPGSDSNVALMRFRATGSTEWREGHPLWWDNRIQGNTDPSNFHVTAQAVPYGYKQHRGSIVQVQSNTSYEVQVLTLVSRKLASTTVQTWSEVFPEGTVTQLPSSSTSQLTITTSDSGTASGYHVYTFGVGGVATIDRNHNGNYCILVQGSYVILRGLTLREANEACIGLDTTCHHVVIEVCDASEFGHGDPSNPNPNGGLYACNSGGMISTVAQSQTANLGITNIIIQNNRIHDPAFDANAWGQPPRTASACGPGSNHAAGATGIFLKDVGGQIVIRYNKLYSTFGKMFDDGLGGGQNFSFRGNLGHDSDVYGNEFSHCWDNVYEMEGRNENVRFYENYAEYGLVLGASLGCVSIGPFYSFRNVGTRGARTPGATSAEGYGFKFYGKTVGGSSGGTVDQMTTGGGATYLYHNTLYKSASAEVGNGTINQTLNADQLGLTSVIAKNNILDTQSTLGSGYITTINGDGFADWNYNLVGAGHSSWLQVGAQNIVQNPVYAAASGAEQYTPALGSPQLDVGIDLPNFNDTHLGNGPDLGAQERGATKLQFGVRT